MLLMTVLCPLEASSYTWPTVAQYLRMWGLYLKTTSLSTEDTVSPAGGGVKLDTTKRELATAMSKLNRRQTLSVSPKPPAGLESGGKK